MVLCTVLWLVDGEGTEAVTQVFNILNLLAPANVGAMCSLGN